MKKIILTVVVALALTADLFAQTNSSPNSVQSEYPVTGMSAVQLVAFINEIKLPVGPRIIGITVKNERSVTIRTGRLTGPLAGAGEDITFEKKDGKWIETNRIHWVS